MIIDTHTAGRGLRHMFIAQLLVILGLIFCAMTSVWKTFGTIGLVVILIGLVISLVGISIASEGHPTFKAAFVFTILNIGICFSLAFVTTQQAVNILNAVSSFLSIATTILIVIGASGLCNSAAVPISAFGRFIMFLYTLIILAVAVLNILAALDIWHLPVSETILNCMSIAASVCYVLFLGKASKALLRAE